MSKKISVALCSYNGEAYIEEQIDSILNQSLLPDEIIITDDSSSDRTVEIIKEKLKESTIYYKIIINSERLGVIKNFEKAIKNCSGDIIILSDQDDVWLERKVQYIVEEFNKKENLSLVFSNAFLTDSQLKKEGILLWDVMYKDIKRLKSKDDYFKLLLRHNIITGATLAFRSDLVCRISPFNDLWIHDYWIAILGSLLGEIKAIEAPLILYRRHSKNLIGADKLNVFEKTQKYFNNFKNLTYLRKNKNSMISQLDKFIKKQNIEINLENRKDLDECLSFWNTMVSLEDKGRIGSGVTIIKEYFRGNYHKYYTGTLGAFRDFLAVFFM